MTQNKLEILKDFERIQAEHDEARNWARHFKRKYEDIRSREREWGSMFSEQDNEIVGLRESLQKCRNEYKTLEENYMWIAKYKLGYLHPDEARELMGIASTLQPGKQKYANIWQENEELRARNQILEGAAKAVIVSFDSYPGYRDNHFFKLTVDLLRATIYPTDEMKNDEK